MDETDSSIPVYLEPKSAPIYSRHRTVLVVFGKNFNFQKFEKSGQYLKQGNSKGSIWVSVEVFRITMPGWLWKPP